MKKLKLLIVTCALMFGATSANAETDYTNLMPSTWTNSTDDFQGGKERYQAANYDSGKIMYQSFTVPAAGIYEIKFYAVASSTSGRNFDNIYGDDIAQAYATAGSNKATVAMTVIDQTGCTLVADANIRTLSVEAAEGETIEYGLENIATGGNWYTIKGLSAKMKTVAEIFQSQYDDALAIYNNSTENEEGARETFKTYVDALNTAMSGTLADAQTASDNLAAALVTYESKSYPVKGSGVKYDFTSKMNMAIDAWTCAQGNGPAQYGFTGATETYGNTTAGEVMYQTISGLASGEYEIHFYAVANAANGGGTAGSGLTYVYANDQKQDIDVISQSTCTPSDYERTLTVMVKEGTIKYGITNTAVAGNWNICKNVALYMTGAPDLSDYYDVISEKLTTANGLKSSPMNSTILSALSAAIDATEGYESITVTATLETLSSDLTTAINNANTSIANYEAALAILNAASTLDAAGKASYAANTTVAGLQEAYNERTLETVTSEQVTACEEALRVAAKAQTSEGADMTLAIVNPNIDGNANGWTTVKTVSGNGPMYGTTAFEYWSYTPGEGGFDYYQIITELPDGIYTVSAEMFNDQVAKDDDTFAAAAGVYGNSGETTVYGLITEQGTTWKRYTTDEIFVSDGILRIGVKNKTTEMPARWVVADNFKITYVRAATVDEYKVALEAAIGNANALKGKNVGEGVFQIPASANATLASAITTAQSVYENASATVSDVTSATSDMNSAISAFKNAELNAPTADTRYYLTVATSGHAKNGNAIVVNLGATNDNNKTGYGFAAAATPNPNLAQAFIFTQVSVNNYKIGVERPEGMVYLTYGSLNNSAAEWATQQIQGTTDASAAGEFKIVATTTDNVFNIVNTVYTGSADNYVDCQAGGSLYTDTNIDFKDFSLSEASQASVAINTTVAKWGTTILPFAVAELPTGVKAYTCAAKSSDTQLTLVEANSIAANIPYIIQGVWDETLTGWGLGAATSYTEGWLTGVYESTPAPVGSYVMQKNTEGVGFYQVAEGEQPTVGANRCYLTVSANARAAFFLLGEEATAIEAIEVLTSGEAEVYTVGGARVPGLQKGMNIVRKADGKSYKVMVK